MADLIVCHAPALLGAHYAVSFFGPCHHPFDCGLEIGKRYGIVLPSCRDDRGFIDQIDKVGSGKSCRQTGNGIEVERGIRGHAPDMYLQVIDPSFPVGLVHHDLTVKPSGSQQRLVEDLGPICCSEKNYARCRIEAVDFRQELIERLLLLVIAARGNVAAAAPERVEFVDEEDRWGGLSCLFKEASDTRRADAHKHLDEFRSGDREERHDATYSRAESQAAAAYAPIDDSGSVTA